MPILYMYLKYIHLCIYYHVYNRLFIHLFCMCAHQWIFMCAYHCIFVHLLFWVCAYQWISWCDSYIFLVCVLSNAFSYRPKSFLDACFLPRYLSFCTIYSGLTSIPDLYNQWVGLGLYTLVSSGRVRHPLDSKKLFVRLYSRCWYSALSGDAWIVHLETFNELSTDTCVNLKRKLISQKTRGWRPRTQWVVPISPTGLSYLETQALARTSK